MSDSRSFFLDGHEVPFEPGQTVLQAALSAGRYIPHLCYHPEFKPHGSCKLCTARVDGRTMAACTTPAAPGMRVESDTEELNALRRDYPSYSRTALRQLRAAIQRNQRRRLA